MLKRFMRAELAKILTVIAVFVFMLAIAALDSDTIPVGMLTASGTWLILYGSANGLFDTEERGE